MFALVGTIGTENNLAIRDYLNDNCVPNIALATGSTDWGEADQYPWYITGLPSYALEANYWLDYIASDQPRGAKIALLYQDDDFGTAYKDALEKAVERCNSEDGTTIEIVAEQGYNPLSGTTTEAATVTQLSSPAPTCSSSGISGTPCPQTLTFVPDTWDPTTLHLGDLRRQHGHVHRRRGGRRCHPGPGDPRSRRPRRRRPSRLQEFREQGAAAGLDEGQLDGGITSIGWGFGEFFALACGRPRRSNEPR